MKGFDGSVLLRDVKTSKIWCSVRSGAAAGAVSAIVFALVHELLISDMWNTVPLMMAAGALCGMGIGWTYGLLFDTDEAGCTMQPSC